MALPEQWCHVTLWMIALGRRVSTGLCPRLFGGNYSANSHPPTLSRELLIGGSAVITLTLGSLLYGGLAKALGFRASTVGDSKVA